MRISAFIFFSFFLALVCVGQGYSQEQDQQTETEAPPSQKVVVGDPAFVGVIEDPEATEASDKREEDSWDIQKRDLVAQERMADATEAMNKATQSMVWAAWASVGFVFVGTFLLGWTLYLTRKANQAARDAVNVTRDVGQKQAMAYLHVTSAYIPARASADSPTFNSLLENERLRVSIEVENFGTTVASNVSVHFGVFDEAKPVGTFKEVELNSSRMFQSVAPNQKRDWVIEDDLRKVVDESTLDDCKIGHVQLRVLRGEIRYSDVFENRFRSTFVLMIVVGEKQEIGLEDDAPVVILKSDGPIFEKITENACD